MVWKEAVDEVVKVDDMKRSGGELRMKRMKELDEWK